MRRAAARELLDELAALDNRMLDLTAGRDPRDGSVSLSLSFSGANVYYSSSGFSVTVDGARYPVPLRYNRAIGIFEGEATDDSRAAVPGDERQLLLPVDDN